MIKQKIEIDASWSLFLDRDGVINERLPGAYVQYWSQFRFTEGTLPALAQFADWFRRIFIVTNQQGIGKNLMTREMLEAVHYQMLKDIEQANGRIDHIYFCPDLRSKPNNCRKPNPAMGILAKKNYPEIFFNRSIMVGDSIADIQFGHHLGMTTILVIGKAEEHEKWTQLPKSQHPHFKIRQLANLIDLIYFNG